MTATTSSIQGGAHITSLSAHEAALVGALRAFGRSSTRSTSGVLPQKQPPHQRSQALETAALPIRAQSVKRQRSSPRPGALPTQRRSSAAALEDKGLNDSAVILTPAAAPSPRQDVSSQTEMVKKKYTPRQTRPKRTSPAGTATSSSCERSTKASEASLVSSLPNAQTITQQDAPTQHMQSSNQAPAYPMSITAEYNYLNPRRTSKLDTDDSLANAIVASSLASTRAPSSMRQTEPPVAAPKTLRKTKSHNILHREHAPTTTKKLSILLPTLRDEQSDTSSAASDGDPYFKHKKKRRIRRHPNRHAEGDRKRWRDAVTDRERKRYEGVWAANKLALDSDGPHAETVSGAVVRDIWSRSRLPENELSEVWDLVDEHGLGSLNREEFVVGLWLIDQRLKGRKLPAKVGVYTWNSVKFLQGLKIKAY